MLTVAATPASAAHVTIYPKGGSRIDDSGPGLASVEKSTSGVYGLGRAYEFLGGAAASSSAAARAPKGVGGDQNIQVHASASFADKFRVGPADLDPSNNLGGGIYFLGYKVRATGDLSFSESAISMNPSAGYTFAYNVGSQMGSGGLYRGLYEGKEFTYDNGPGGVFSETLLVGLNEVVSVNLNAGTFASASAYCGPVGCESSALADFGHTLAWGGIHSVQYRDASGKLVDAPAGFRLKLVSETTGFDYWNPAGPNPYTTAAVPEPATWALMIGGFGLAGTMLRRRRASAA